MSPWLLAYWQVLKALLWERLKAFSKTAVNWGICIRDGGRSPANHAQNQREPMMDMQQSPWCPYTILATGSQSLLSSVEIAACLASRYRSIGKWKLVHLFYVCENRHIFLQHLQHSRGKCQRSIEFQGKTWETFGNPAGWRSRVVVIDSSVGTGISNSSGNRKSGSLSFAPPLGYMFRFSFWKMKPQHRRFWERRWGKLVNSKMCGASCNRVWIPQNTRLHAV